MTFVLFYKAQVALNGWMTDHGWIPPTLERALPILIGHSDSDLRDIRGAPGLRGLLAASHIAPGWAGGGRCIRCTTHSDK